MRAIAGAAMNWRKYRDLSDEIEGHLAEKVAELIGQGMPPEQARYTAQREFGNLTRIKERSRDVWRFHWIEDAFADLRYALSQLVRSPAFITGAVVTLALGIGANSAIYSVMNAALLRPVPYSHPQRLILMWTGEPEQVSFYSFSYPRFEFFRQRLSDSIDLAAYDDEIITVAHQDEPERIEGGRVSANFFSVLGVKPALGRGFLPSEDQHGAPPVAILSDSYWRKRYRADPHILGRAVRVDAEVFTIVGVLPPGFEFHGQPVGIWRSRIIDTRTYPPESVRLGATYLTAVGRLRDGASLQQARAKLVVLDARYRQERRGMSDESRAVYASALEDQIFASAHAPLFVLWGAVSCLLLIACSNVANLVLARAVARHRELSVRIALGASRSRIARQLITESVFLAICGGLAALPIAWWSMPLLVANMRQTAPIPDAHLDLRVIAVTFAVATIIGIAVGLAPLLFLLRDELRGATLSGGRTSSANAWSVRFRKVVVAGEVALCLVLLTGAGLLAQSFARMNRMRTGLEAANVVTAPLDLMPDRYESWEARQRFYNDVLQRAGAIPGVTHAGITSRIDLIQRGLGYMVRVEGAADLGPQNPRAGGRSVSPDYLPTIGVPLLGGRMFTERDTASSPRVMIVNETFAKRFFAGQNPLGKHVTYSTDRISCEIVGLLRDVRSSMTREEAAPEMYLPLTQRSLLVAHLVVRAGAPNAIAAALRKEIQAADPQQAVGSVGLFEDWIAESLGQPRMTMWIVVVFAVVALFLAAIGIYGIAAYGVAQRTKEIGIRMALGADGRQVRALVFRESIQVLLLGLIAGLPLSVLLGQAYSRLLFQVSPYDPLTFAIVVATLTIAVVAASYFPALQATEVDPVASLRAA